MRARPALDAIRQGLLRFGLWPAGGAQRYVRQVRTISQRCKEAQRKIGRTQVSRREQRRKQLRSQEHPAELARDAAEILELLGPADTPGPFAEKLERRLTDRPRLQEHLNRIETDHPDAPAHAYVGRVRALLQADQDELIAAITEHQRATSEAIAGLEALKVPAQVRDAHDAYCAALRDQWIETNTLHVALRDEDAAAARAAVRTCIAAEATAAAAIRRINADLGRPTDPAPAQ